MKKLIFVFLFLPFLAFSQQVQPSPSVDLKMDSATKLKKSKRELIIGAVVTAVGAGMLGLAPSLYSKPTQPVLLPPTSQANLFANSKTMNAYNQEVKNYDSNVKTTRYVGAGVTGLGAIMVIHGAINIGKAKKSAQ